MDAEKHANASRQPVRGPRPSWLQGPMAAEILQRSRQPISRRWHTFTPPTASRSPSDGARVADRLHGRDGLKSPVRGRRPHVVDGMLETGRRHGAVPVGLGPGYLRLEAGYMLYGNELDETTSLWKRR